MWKPVARKEIPDKATVRQGEERSHGYPLAQGEKGTGSVSAMSKLWVSSVVVYCVWATGPAVLGGQSVKPGSGGQSASTGAERELAGEKAAVELLGLKDSYGQMFSARGGTVVALAFAFGQVGKTVEVTSYYEPKSGDTIGYSWAPQNSDIAQMTKQQVVAKCGKPDQVAGDQIAYGRVYLSFGKGGHLSKITILFEKRVAPVTTE